MFSALAEEFLFRSTIIGSNPNTVIGGIKSGGHPNAEIESRINLPSPCFGPVVLVRANGTAGPWIAGTGFTNTSEPNNKDDEDRN